MAISFEYLPCEYDGTPLLDLCGAKNDPRLPGGIIEKLVEEFGEINGLEPNTGDRIFIPILPPFRKKYEGLVTAENLSPPDPEPEPAPIVVEPEPTPKPVAEAAPRSTPKPVPRVEEKPKVVTSERPKKTKRDAQMIKEPAKHVGKIQFKLFPYTFSRPGETIEAVIRLYNDMQTGQATMKKLVYEFTRANLDALPPKLGQTVKVPVLLPFVYRHVNENQIFKDA